MLKSRRSRKFEPASAGPARIKFMTRNHAPSQSLSSRTTPSKYILIRTTKISHPAFVSTLTLLPSAASLESTARHGVPFNTSLIMVFPILPSPGAPSMTKEGYPQLRSLVPLHLQPHSQTSLRASQEKGDKASADLAKPRLDCRGRLRTDEDGRYGF